MKKITFLLIACLVMNITVNATVRRVGFSATNPVAGVDFYTLQSAHDASSAGDTLQIYPTNQSTTYTCNMTKKLVLVGTGYFTDGGFNSNTGLQNITGSCSVSLTLDAGSSGSLFEGLGTEKMAGYNTPSNNFLTIAIVQFASVNNITVKRCTVSGVTFADYAPNDSWIFTQCYFYNNNLTFYPISAGTPTIGGNAVTNLRIENCIFTNAYIDFTNGPVTGITGQMVNNVFTYSANIFNLQNGSFLIENNIFPSGGGSSYFSNVTNCVFQNNITSSPQAGNAMNTLGSSGNKYAISFSNVGGSTSNYNTVFVGYPYNVTTTGGSAVYSQDAMFQLIPNSAASGAGNTGSDCGIFGGVAPYKLSGIPTTPAFYLLSAPSNTANSSPYTITFSVRSNN